MSLWRRWSQLTAGLSTAARNTAITNQPTNVRTCHIRNNAPSTTNTVKRVTATVRTTCEVEAPTHPPSWLGMDALGSADTFGGCAWNFSCGSACGFLCVSFSSFISMNPAALQGAAEEQHRVGRQSKSSCARLLPSGHLIGPHPLL